MNSLAVIHYSPSAQGDAVTANNLTTPVGISKTPGVLGGEARVRNTRIAVWMLVRARELGIADQELVERYSPLLTADDLTNAWSYYAAHRDEVDAALRRNEED
jgi:uncharacterized protein (DUF433 family)